ncbi:MAG: DUF362 domain-containing protein [Firmicutes bacterium]|nr:DUF362 domain-containing protein [Bacillota bacterium]
MNKIALARCGSYERNEVEKAVHQCLAELGGLGRWIAPGQKVLVKPNILAAEPPEKGVDTHPEVVRAVLKALLESGARPIVGDSPGVGSLARAAEKAGIAAACRELGVPLAAFNEEVEVRTAPDGKILKSFPLAREVTEVDVVINLPRVKTHGLTRLTGAVKNLFGCVVGLHKGEMHFRLQRADVFQEMLIDLALTVKPALTLVDGVMAMEGAGPRNGDLRFMGLILAGENPFAVDAAIARLVGLEPTEVPVLALAAKRGITGIKESEMELLGEKLEDLLIPDFNVPAAKNMINLRVPDWVVRLFRRFVSPYPVIREHCRRCLVCMQACPAKVISVAHGQMVIDDQHCIRCYCCQEFCPHDAIELKVPFGGRLI